MILVADVQHGIDTTNISVRDFQSRPNTHRIECVARRQQHGLGRFERSKLITCFLT